MKWKAALASIALLNSGTAVAAVKGNPPPPSGGETTMNTSFITPEAITGVTVLAFGLIMAFLGVHLLTKGKIPTDDVIRFLALITVVSGTLFLVACGYNAEDISPAIGLLGTIAGYLLGKGSRSPAPAATNDQAAGASQ